ncbi:unnamed protein product [Ilex paraguariensis]|uniref:Glycosyltransferase n=1 Tax=Ilex paraguariensis TaxID=185542 RepID=A0ABC8SEM3_9AQUA
MANQHHHNHGQNGQKDTQVVVVMVPLPAQGHLNQLLHLSRLITAYNIPVHYVTPTTHGRQVKLRVQGWDPLATTNIHFHEFPIPSFVCPPPDPNASSPYPSQILPSFRASLSLREPVGSLLRSLSATTERVIVIHDSLMASVVQDVPSIANAESYCFLSTSAFSTSLFSWEATREPVSIEPEILKESPSFESCFVPELLEFAVAQDNYREFNSGSLHNSCRVIENHYLDILAKKEIIGSVKQWVIGPFNPVEIPKNENSNGPQHPCLDWLDKQPPKSVIFVSFGTTTSLTDEQTKELAIGLEKSEQNFIWVLRDADKGDMSAGEVKRSELPEGFEERVKGRGKVLTDWAPQLEILGHPSTGGFLSHCGWNSCLESISMGVPMATWPMHSDQPSNALLITKVLKVGLAVKDWARRHEIVNSLMVENAVKRLMVSAEGEEMRKRAGELGGAVRKSVEEGGLSRLDMDSFIAHITR